MSCDSAVASQPTFRKEAGGAIGAQRLGDLRHLVGIRSQAVVLPHERLAVRRLGLPRPHHVLRGQSLLRLLCSDCTTSLPIDGETAGRSQMIIRQRSEGKSFRKPLLFARPLCPPLSSYFLFAQDVISVAIHGTSGQFRTVLSSLSIQFGLVQNHSVMFATGDHPIMNCSNWIITGLRQLRKFKTMRPATCRSRDLLAA